MGIYMSIGIYKSIAILGNLGKIRRRKKSIPGVAMKREGWCSTAVEGAVERGNGTVDGAVNVKVVGAVERGGTYSGMGSAKATGLRRYLPNQGPSIPPSRAMVEHVPTAEFLGELNMRLLPIYETLQAFASILVSQHCNSYPFY